MRRTEYFCSDTIDGTRSQFDIRHWANPQVILSDANVKIGQSVGMLGQLFQQLSSIFCLA